MQAQSSKYVFRTKVDSRFDLAINLLSFFLGLGQAHANKHHMANEYEREKVLTWNINISNTSKMLCIKSNHIFLQEYMNSLEACKSKIMFCY